MSSLATLDKGYMPPDAHHPPVASCAVAVPACSSPQRDIPFEKSTGRPDASWKKIAIVNDAYTDFCDR
ncbi:MAG: hypothetical protein HYR84_06090 [Planctomycetes bacterium]|nr:hypothetical protein [Planctomycetota bacterium]